MNSEIKGRCLDIIVGMYNGIKSVIKLNGNMSDIFLCNVGVRQGENLSPILFISAIKLLFQQARKAMYGIKHDQLTCLLIFRLSYLIRSFYQL